MFPSLPKQRLLFTLIAASGAWIASLTDLIQQADQAMPYRLSLIFTRYLLPQVSEPTALWISLAAIGLAGALLVVVHEPEKKLDAFSWGLSVFAVLGVGANPAEELHRSASLAPIPAVYAQAEASGFSLIWGKEPLKRPGRLKVWDASGDLVRDLRLNDQVTSLDLEPGRYRVEMRAAEREPVAFGLTHRAEVWGYFIPSQPSSASAWLQLFQARSEPEPVPLEDAQALEALLSP